MTLQILSGRCKCLTPALALHCRDNAKVSPRTIATDKRGYPHNIFLISRQKHMLWYSLEAPQRGAFNEYPQHMFSLRNKKDISSFRMKKVSYLLLCRTIACTPSVCGRA